MSFEDYLYGRLAEIRDAQLDQRTRELIEGDGTGEPTGIIAD